MLQGGDELDDDGTQWAILRGGRPFPRTAGMGRGALEIPETNREEVPHCSVFVTGGTERRGNLKQN